MRIALVSYDFGEYCIRQASALAESHEVLLVLPERLSEPHLSLLDARVQFKPFKKPRLRQPIRQLGAIRLIHREIRKFGPDVIHFQPGHMWFNVSLPLLRSIPLVFTIHDARQHLGDRGALKTPQAIMDFGFRRADQVIVHGQAVKDTVVREVGIRAERVHVIPHVAIGERTHVRVAETREPRILFFGRIWDYKGLEYFVRAEPRVSGQFPGTKFVIAGAGDDFSRYERLMKNPGNFVVHNRWVSDDERAELFQQSRMVVLPYIEASQSGVVPVAYTYRKPVIATTVGGLPEAVEHGETGLLVPPRDEVALADAIIQLLRDPELCSTMGNRGRQKLDTEWSPTVVAALTERVYQSAVDTFRSSKQEPAAANRSVGANET